MPIGGVWNKFAHAMFAYGVPVVLQNTPCDIPIHMLTVLELKLTVFASVMENTLVKL